jgi:hypothetical protein
MIGNIRTKAGGHKVFIISLDNYKNFCTLPKSVETKYRLHQMPIQQFADVLRTCLLCQKGGLWIDGTILLVRQVPDIVFELPIYNVKGIDGHFDGALRVTDSTLYQSYFISSQPKSATYSFIMECLTKYWNTNDTLIDYFLISYLAKIARDEIPACQQEYSQIPDNNRKCELLNDYLMKGQALRGEDINTFLHSDTWLYKLSWKSVYPETTKTDDATFFSYILRYLTLQSD